MPAAPEFPAAKSAAIVLRRSNVGGAATATGGGGAAATASLIVLPFCGSCSCSLLNLILPSIQDRLMILMIPCAFVATPAKRGSIQQKVTLVRYAHIWSSNNRYYMKG